eukprot:TRINITY_DN5111_c0_g1::TRINITY_DN5111_c0_g1_i1::g.29347::m.29347 TRINITY_DN5111_c0_g1::TRINITY_DN5111_c0_g1_i1::g.29347  ORF type:complete len:317 (+),score=41.77,sp/Q66KM2/NDRG2_XENTR/30.54/9e-39,Ndr/PF03096.9/3.6e-62,Abhydrolase_6/PF12697.2/3.2e-11,B12D/PF06522.6/0.31 TRINITY_DN5111_c0_g1_i1:32-982(+)
MADALKITIDPNDIYIADSLGQKKKHVVNTKYGPITVTELQGNGQDRRDDGYVSLHSIVTYHDYGLDHRLCWDTLFNYLGSRSFLKNFTIFHFDAPGHEEGAGEVGDEAPKTMDEMADQVFNVMTEHFNVHRFVGFGMGAGANILLRVALINPSVVMGLVLIGPELRPQGWIDWAYQKMTSGTINVVGLTEGEKQALLQRYFGQNTFINNGDLVQTYHAELTRIPAKNILRFSSAYAQRTDLSNQDLKHLLRFTRIMVISPKECPMQSESIFTFSKCNPGNSALLEGYTGLLVTEEDPQSLQRPLDLYFKALGFLN